MKSSYIKNLARLLLVLNICLLLSGCVISRNADNDKVNIKQEETGQMKENGNAGEITINYNEKQSVLKVITGGESRCLMLPGKELAEFLGLFADWDSERNILGLSDGMTPSAVQEGNIKANVNNNMKLLEAAPAVLEGELFIPVSFISGTYGFNVDMDSAVTTLTITRNGDNANNKTGGTASNGTSGKANDKATEKEAVIINSPIVGFWSTVQSFTGDIIDVQTGITSGQYSGEWYLFSEDGTYQHIVIGSGLVISGTAAQSGNFSLEGNKVKLYNNKESWYPSVATSGQKKSYENKPTDDQEGVFSIEDDGSTLSIDFGISSKLSRVVN